MISIERCDWRNKVTTSLLERYDKAIAEGDNKIYRVVLEYRGNFSRFPLDLEVLSVVEGQLQVIISLPALPALASINEISRIRLPIYRRTG